MKHLIKTILIFFLFNNTLKSCDCDSVISNLSLAIYGKVVEIKMQKSSARTFYKITFLHLGNSTGNYEKKLIQIYTTLNTASCGYPFEVDKYYHVPILPNDSTYKTKGVKGFETSWCTNIYELEIPPK